VHPGVYRLPGAPVTWKQKVMAAVLAAGPGAVASHKTAAALWGLAGFPPREVEVTLPHGKYRPGCHQSRSLERVDVTTIDGIPVTRVARTLVDLAGAVSDARLEDAIDDALCRRL